MGYCPWGCKDLDMTERLTVLLYNVVLGLLLWLSGKESSCNAGAAGDAGSIPGLGGSPEGGNGYLLQCSCLENLMDRRAWWAMVPRVKKSRTLK